MQWAWNQSVWDLIIIIIFSSTKVWTQDIHLEPLHHPYFCDGIFWDRVAQTILNHVSLISASWLARITGMSHQHPAHFVFLHLFWANPEQELSNSHWPKVLTIFPQSTNARLYLCSTMPAFTLACISLISISNQIYILGKLMSLIEYWRYTYLLSKTDMAIISRN
jgi:hypothetical protein